MYSRPLSTQPAQYPEYLLYAYLQALQVLCGPRRIPSSFRRESTSSLAEPFAMAKQNRTRDVRQSAATTNSKIYDLVKLNRDSFFIA